MRDLSAALVENPLPEHIKVTVFMDGLIVGPARTQLFRVHANTTEEAIQIALQKEYNHRQARTPATSWQGNSAPGSVQDGSPGNGATSGPVPMELGNIVPHKAIMADDARDESGVAQGDSEPKAKAPQMRSSDGHYHVFDSETGHRVKANAVQLDALPEVAEHLNLEEMSLDDFLADLKAGDGDRTTGAHSREVELLLCCGLT
ncbi:unnamed protein product [Phytophthora fragariaefolia]|uniref:Unnamed protein product n=1 Tax=Phytophthora fragariaefolia TaxID=1490495 RepID=A0A9W6X8X0_9STRA|nr:unnamed protein product [Phytophthora fragariaefolia]